MVQPSLWGRFSMRMETGCYGPLENKMRCQLNCRPSVSQTFKRRKSSTQGWRQQLSGQPGAPGALQGPREASLCSTGHQAGSEQHCEQTSQEVSSDTAVLSSLPPWTGDRRQAGRLPTPPIAHPALGRRLTMQPADNKTLPSAVITP